MAQQVVTELVIDADTSGADRFESAMARAGGSADKGTMSVQQLSLAVAGVGVAVAGAIVGLRGFVDYVGSQSQALVDMAEHARLAGLSTREFQQTLFAARSAGLTEKDFVSGLDKISANLTAAGRGVTDFGRLFEANGISIRKANGELKTGGEALADLARLMQNASPQIQQAMAKIAGLSASWIPMLRQGVDGIEAQKKAAADLGVIIDDDIIAKAREFNAQWKQAVATWDLQFKASIASIMPLMIKLANIASSIIESVGAVSNTLFRVTTPDSEKTSSQVNDQINEVQRLIELMQKYGEMPERVGTLGSLRSMQVYNLKGALGLPEDADFKKVFGYLDELTRRYDELQKKRVLLPTSGGTTVLPQAEATRSALDGEIDRIEKHIALLQADTEAVGQSEAARAGLRAEAALYAAAERSGFKDMERFAEQFHAIREAVEQATAALAKARVASDIKFGKQTIGLSQEDVQIAQTLRGIYPDVATALGSVEAQMMRVTNAQKMLADGFREVGKEIFSAFLSGKNMMDAMVRSLDAVASKLANAAFDNLLSGNPLQMGIGALQAGASALISIFTSDRKAEKELEEARKRWEAMADQVLAFNRAAEGFDLGPLTGELNSLQSSLMQLSLAALEAREFGELRRLQDQFNRGAVRIVDEFKRGNEVLSPFAEALRDLNGEARGLKESLEAIGLSELAAEIDATLPGLVQALRDQFSTDLTDRLNRSINSSRGQDYLNEVADALADLGKNLADAALLGSDALAALANQEFLLRAQSIVDAADLTGSAFDDLIAKFPQLRDAVQEDAEERTRILQEALEAQKRQAMDYKQYIDQLLGGPSAALSPIDRLNTTETAYREQLALARSGDTTAQQGLTGYFDRYREAAAGFYGTAGVDYQRIIAGGVSDLRGLSALLAPGLGLVSDTGIVSGTTPPPSTATGGGASNAPWGDMAALREELVALREEVAGLRADANQRLDTGNKVAATAHVESQQVLSSIDETLEEIRIGDLLESARPAA